MIGGTVIEVIDVGDKVWINCRELQSTSECAIYVERNAKSRSVYMGDSIWWQGDSAYWGPKCFKTLKDRKAGVHYDIELKRIGNSGQETKKCRSSDLC